MSDRYVVLGLARPRAPWFSELSRWATTAAIPVEFVKCLTPDEARARLASGRRWSALLVDAGAHGVDRDLLDAAAAVGTAAIVVADDRVDRAWTELGARAVLPSDLERDDLLRVLAEHARPVSRAAPTPDLDEIQAPPPWRGALVAVTGTGGSGASTIAAMLAHGIGTDARERGLVILADLALAADQAVIHDTDDVSPALPELVELHRLGRSDPDDVRGLVFSGGRERPYDLLIGLRRHRDWTLLRPRAVAAALDGLRATYRTVVTDVDSDIEGERDTGSHDIEDRNVLARSAIGTAEAVVVVGRADVVGIHRLSSTLRDLRRFGVPADRLLPLVNRAPRSPATRADITSAVARLAFDDAESAIPPLYVAERRRLDDLVRVGAPWPAGPSRDIASAVRAITARHGPVAPDAGVPERVAPGSLGTFADLESDAS
jgi:hypothetical protein